VIARVGAGGAKGAQPGHPQSIRERRGVADKLLTCGFFRPRGRASWRPPKYVPRGPGPAGSSGPWVDASVALSPVALARGTEVANADIYGVVGDHLSR